jgi:hypothetical protein
MFFFQFVLENKDYLQIAQNKGQGGRGGLKAEFQKLEFLIKQPFFHTLYFCPHGKLSFIPFGVLMRKYWIVFFFRAMIASSRNNNL